MRFGLCTDIRNVKDVQEVGFDYIEGKLNQFALWSEEEFESVLELFSSSSIKMETTSLLLPKTMKVIGKEYNEKELLSYLDAAFHVHQQQKRPRQKRRTYKPYCNYHNKHNA